MKILAVTCNTAHVADTLEWLKKEPGVYIVKVAQLSEYLQNIKYPPGDSIIMIRIMDKETELLLKLKYPPGIFIDSLEL